MNTTLPLNLLSPPQAYTGLHEQLMNDLELLIQPDAVYLLGTTYNSLSSAGIFLSANTAPVQPVGFVLLILLQEQDSRDLLHWQDRIEQQLQKIIPVTALVLASPTFHTWLSSGHPFAQRVSTAATLLYGNAVGTTVNLQESLQTAQDKDLIKSHGQKLATEFLAGAQLYLLRRQPALAAFLLHQSVEQILFTTLLLGTGYHCQIHNLSRLLRLCSLVSPEVQNIFPQQKETDKTRFQLLQKAYIASRYNPDFTIGNQDLEILSQQTTALLNWFKARFIGPQIS